MEIVEREASRLLVISPAGTVLLLRLEATFRDPFWVTPGGGLDDGETHEEAALRKLREEVGRDDLTLGPWIATMDEAVYPLDLATLLEHLLRDGPPEHAIDLGASVED